MATICLLETISVTFVTAQRNIHYSQCWDILASCSKTKQQTHTEKNRTLIKLAYGTNHDVIMGSDVMKKYEMF